MGTKTKVYHSEVSMEDDIRKMNETIGSHGGVELVPNDPIQTPHTGAPNAPTMDINEMNKRMAEAFRNVNTNSGGNSKERGAEIISQLTGGGLQTIKREDGPMAEVIGEGAPIEKPENISENQTVQGVEAEKLSQNKPAPNLQKPLAATPKITPLPQPSYTPPPERVRPSTAGGAMGGLSGDICSQCGLMHPPISGKCPNVQAKDADGKDIDTRKFLADMKNILESKIAEKKIKNHNKFFGHVTVELMKVIEKYEEGKEK